MIQAKHLKSRQCPDVYAGNPPLQLQTLERSSQTLAAPQAPHSNVNLRGIGFCLVMAFIRTPSWFTRVLIP